MAGIDDGSLVGFIRGITARKRQANIEEGQRNYLTDPQAAIAAVNQVKGGGPEAAYQLQQRMKSDQASDLQTQQAAQTRYLGAVKNMAGMLGQARDSGADVGAAFDTMAPVMQKGLGMSPEEIQQYRAAIIANPAMIDALGRDADAKLMNVAAGGSVFDPNSRKEIFNNPGVAKPIQIKRGDGGTDVLIYDPESRSFVQTGGAAPQPGAGVPGAGGPAPVPGNFTSMTSKQLAPHVIAQESGGDYTAVSPAGALGAYQVMPDTAKALAKRLGIEWNPGLMTSNTAQGRAYQDQIGDAAIQEAQQASGGNPTVFGMYYHGGSDKSKWGPKTRQYGDQFAQRLSGTGGNVSINGAGVGGPAYSTPGKPTKPGYRIATAEEKKAAGVDPDTPYQINGENGKLEKIGERPMGGGSRNLGKANPTQIVSFYKDVQSLRNEVARLLASPDLDGAVGPVQSRVAGYYSKGAKQFQNDVESIGSRLVVQTLNKMKALSATGASGFGNFSNKEGDRLAEQMGSLQLSGSEEGVRRTFKNIIQWADDQLGSMPNIGAVPNQAIQYLKTHPGTRAQFDQHYGEGMSTLFLGK